MRQAMKCVAVKSVILMLAIVAGVGFVTVRADAQTNPNVRPPANAVIPAPSAAPGSDKASNYDVELWRKVRKGVEGNVSIPDKKAGVLVQSGGEAWRNMHNGPLPTYGLWGLGGILGLLALFYLVRGKIRIDHGWSGRTIERFSNLERMAHWLMAVSFIVLAISGLNVMYGKYVLLPIIGKGAFASLSMLLKWLHNHVAFAFMIGLAVSFVMWLRHNLPTLTDLKWLALGGGMFSKGSHPPARKFNAGQKILFWMIMLGGFSISLSGLALMFPFQTSMFAKTFGVLNVFGLSLPAAPTAIQEMQFASTWHAIMGLFLTVVIFAHIYIGTIGMEGAFDAMGSGHVDENWAKEHHSIWAEEELAKMRESKGVDVQPGAGAQPAE